MRYAYKIIIFFSTVCSISCFARDTAYLAVNGHFSIPTSKKSWNSENSRLQKKLSYGMVGGIPVAINVGKSKIQSEILYNHFFAQATRKIIIEKAKKNALPSSSKQKLPWLEEPTWAFPDQEIEQSFNTAFHLVGIVMKAHYPIFSKNIHGFVGIMPFTGICIENTLHGWHAKARPLLAEIGIKHVFYKNFYWTFNGSYLKLFGNHLYKESAWNMQAELGLQF